MGRRTREFSYQDREDYDVSTKVNGDQVRAYSEKRLQSLHPGGGANVVGETYAGKKRDRSKDLGRIELAGTWLYVGEDGGGNRLLRKRACYVEVEGGQFIALLKVRLLPIILACALAAACLGGALWGFLSGDNSQDPSIAPAQTSLVTVSGTVRKAGEAAPGATLSLQSGNQEVAKATTDQDGNYLIGDVRNGSYNLVCSYDGSVLTKIATVSGKAVVVDFDFPADDLNDVGAITGTGDPDVLPDVSPSNGDTAVKARVSIAGANTTAVAVGGLATEALLHMQVDKEVDLTFTAQRLEAGAVPGEDEAAIRAICGQLDMIYYDFSILKEVFAKGLLESSEKLASTNTVLEIAVPYDSSRAVGTYAFRYHQGAAQRFEQLDRKPTSDFRDGTYYVTADTVFIYASRFCTYGIGSADGGRTTKGSDEITYRDTATVNLATGKAALLYEHGEGSTHDARVQLFLVGRDGNLLVAESGVVPVGYRLEEVDLEPGIEGRLKVGTYDGLMTVSYLDAGGNVNTNVDIPLSVAVTQ